VGVGAGRRGERRVAHRERFGKRKSCRNGEKGTQMIGSRSVVTGRERGVIGKGAVRAWRCFDRVIKRPPIV
jgi:hypothetical protein